MAHSVFSTHYNRHFFLGHITPVNLPEKQRLSWERHRHARPPRADDQTFDCVAQGWIGPVKDQGQCGSCHSADTEVLTEKGWVLWPDYDWRQPLGTMDPATGELVFQPPLVRHVYDHDGPMYYYEGRSLDFALTPDHRMIWRRNKGAWVKSPVAELPAYADIPHATTGWLGTELVKLEAGGQCFAGDDFLALVALVVSDGHVLRSSDKNCITFRCFREDRLDAVRALAQRIGAEERASRPGVWNIYRAGLAEWFLQNAYGKGGFTAPRKHIPDVVKCASQRQIAHFLKFFGDRHAQAYGGRRFYSRSHRVIDDLQELLLRVGKRGTVEEGPPRTGPADARGRRVEGRHPELVLTERERDGLCVERENLRVDHYKGKVYCATVPNGSLLTRRNKRVLISSNCWDFSGTGVVESALIKAGILKNDGSGALDEQYILDCVNSGGCNGDDNTTVLDAAKSKGMPLTSDYGPYRASPAQCGLKPSCTLYQIDDWGYCSGNGPQQGVAATQDIKDHMKAYGGIGCAVAADGAFSNYSGGVFQSTTSTGIDHDVMLVGWDMTKVPGKTVWKMRNSWGPGWGDQGYMWIVEGVNLIGTEAVFAKKAGPGPAPPPGPNPPGPPAQAFPNYALSLSGDVGGQNASLAGLAVPLAVARQRLSPAAWEKVLADLGVLVKDVQTLLADLGLPLAKGDCGCRGK